MSQSVVVLPVEMYVVAASLTQAWATLNAGKEFRSDAEYAVYDVFGKYLRRLQEDNMNGRSAMKP